jgi:hypothetical protein
MSMTDKEFEEYLKREVSNFQNKRQKQHAQQKRQQAKRGFSVHDEDTLYLTLPKQVDNPSIFDFNNNAIVVMVPVSFHKDELQRETPLSIIRDKFKEVFDITPRLQLYTDEIREWNHSKTYFQRVLFEIPQKQKDKFLEFWEKTELEFRRLEMITNRNSVKQMTGFEANKYNNDIRKSKVNKYNTTQKNKVKLGAK